jgi:hypothetical protein
MQRTLRWVCPLVVLAVLGSVFAADAKKTDKADPKKPAKTDTRKRLTQSYKLVGKVIKIENSKKDFDVKVKVYDPAKLQSLQDYINRRTLEIARIGNFAEKQRQALRFQAEVAKRKQNLTKDVNLKFTATEDMKVRLKTLPVEYDDKGKPKKLTAKEKAALKGPDKALPGYNAEWENLNKDQTVELYLTKPKPKKGQEKEFQKELDKGDERLEVWLVVIAAEPMTK